jgi:hypothetical protein
MVVHWRKLKARDGDQRLINGLGAMVTGIVLIVVALTKSREGAWIILLLIPVHVFCLERPGDTTTRWRVSCRSTVGQMVPRHRNTVLVPMSGVHRPWCRALEYAKTLSTDVRAVYVSIDPAATSQLWAQWKRWGDGVPLVVLESPYRSLMEPLLEYIDQVDASQPDDFVTIVLPEFVPARWWHHIFHNQRALLIKGALLFRPNVVVTSVPFHLNR